MTYTKRIKLLKSTRSKLKYFFTFRIQIIVVTYVLMKEFDTLYECVHKVVEYEV